MTMKYTDMGKQALSTEGAALTPCERQTTRLAVGAAANQKLLAALGQEGRETVQQLVRQGYLMSTAVSASSSAAQQRVAASQFASTRINLPLAGAWEAPHHSHTARQEVLLDLCFGNDPEDELDFNTEVFELHQNPEMELAQVLPVQVADLEKARHHLVTALSTLPDMQSQKLVQQVLMHKEGELALDYIMRAVEHYADVTDKERASRLRVQLAALLPPAYAPLLELGV